MANKDFYAGLVSKNLMNELDIEMVQHLIHWYEEQRRVEADTHPDSPQRFHYAR